MKRPTFVQTFLITISGAALAFFGCLGFLSGIGRSSNSVAPAIGGIAFALGALMLLVGVAGMIVVLIRAIIRSRQNPSSPPSDSGSPPSSNDPPA